MTITYVVQAGDRLAKIAREHGTTVLAIWNHPENAGHRDRRASPDILYPGDVLRIDALQVPTSPTESVSPAVIPGEPAPMPAVPAFSPWPYPAFKGVWTTGPTWECPGGTCACHPVKETAPGEPHTIVLYDPRGLRMPGARCRAFEQGRLITAEGLTADAAGEVRVTVRATTSTLRVEWAPPDLPGQPFMPYRKLYHLTMDDGDTGLDRRLANLGFSRGKRRHDNVADYQRAYSREPTGDPEEIRLEVLQRHDQGAVEPFHPQGDAPALDRLPRGRSSFFASPTPRSSPIAMLAPDIAGAPAQVGSLNTRQNIQGAVGPDAADLLLLVLVAPDFGPVEPKHTRVRLRPRSVPGLDASLRDQEVEPATAPTSPGTPAVYEFNDLPTGTYDALVYVDNVRDAKGNSVTFALGHTEVTVRKALANQFMLVAHVRRAVLTVDDPLLEFDVPPMQRRRKVLASIFRSFPQSAAPRSEIRELGLKPPYEQGEYKRMTADDSQNTCAAVNTMTYDLATGGIDSAGKALGNGASAGFNSPRSLGWTPYADGLQPSVGDVACYRNSKGEMAHCGFVVGVVQLRKPSKPDEPVGGLQIGWLSADGGQPDRTTEFPSGASGWRRYYSPPRNREAAFVLPRLFVQLGDGRASVQNLFIFPLAERGGYAVEGWLDISQARFGKLEYDEFGTEEDYRAMKALLSTFPRRVDAARQADQDIQSYAAEVPDTTSGEP